MDVLTLEQRQIRRTLWQSLCHQLGCWLQVCRVVFNKSSEAGEGVIPGKYTPVDRRTSDNHYEGSADAEYHSCSSHECSG